MRTDDPGRAVELSGFSKRKTRYKLHGLKTIISETNCKTLQDAVDRAEHAETLLEDAERRISDLENSWAASQADLRAVTEAIEASFPDTPRSKHDMPGWLKQAPQQRTEHLAPATGSYPI